MLKVGLTGGIGSGKSTLVKLFSQHNIPVIDADIIARQLVEQGQPALASLQKIFGQIIIDQEGCLKRNKLKEIIFANATKKKS